MKNWKIFALVITITIAIALIIFLIPLVVGANSGIEVVDWDGDGRWRRDTWYIDLYPGEEASIELEIKSSEDAVIYVEYAMPRGLFIYFDIPAFEIGEDDTEWIEITVYAPGDIRPDEYEIDFNFKAIEIGIETETEIVYRDKQVPGPERIKYVDRVEYVDRKVPEYIYTAISTEGGIDWWWIPISVIFTILITLGTSEIIRKR